jgi:putative oxidoreductase
VDLGLLIIRSYLGAILLAHAGQKALGWWGGPGRPAIAAQFAQWGFRSPNLALLAATACEVVSGVLLLTGLCLPLAAAMVTGAMGVAIWVRFDRGLFAHLGGFEVALTYLVLGVVLAATGPGRFSLDHAAGWHVYGPAWALAAVAVGGLGSLTVVFLRAGRPTSFAITS